MGGPRDVRAGPLPGGAESIQAPRREGNDEQPPVVCRV